MKRKSAMRHIAIVYPVAWFAEWHETTVEVDMSVEWFVR